MQLNKEIILQKLRAIKPDLQEKYNLTELALFGSYARGEQTAQSDIDIMVKMSTPDFRNYSNIYHTLEKFFPEQLYRWLAGTPSGHNILNM
jgi:predicted nucleotidyltransferase